MKKLMALVLVAILCVSCSFSAFAAGTDDGTIFVATKDGEKFLGREIADNLVKYEAANGSGDVFYDINGDKNMDICDLVALCKNEVDFDLSGSFDAADSAALRLMLIGANN